MRFRTRLLLGVVVEIALVLMICATAVVALQANREANHRTGESLADLVGAQDVKNHVNRVSVVARGFLITGDPRFVAQVRASQRELASSAANLDADLDLGTARKEMLERLVAFSEAIDVVIQDRASVADLAALEQLFDEQLAPRRQAVEDVLQELVQRSRGEALAAAAHSERIADTATVVIALGATLAILLAGVLGLVSARRLTAQFRKIQESRQAASDAAAARRELLDIVSHDLRAPLSTITLGIDALREQHGDAPLIHTIDNAAGRMRRLVDDLLDAARAQTIGLALHLERVDCHELLQQALESFSERAARAGVSLQIDHDLHAPVQVDRDRVLQILSNLVANALSVTPRGGTITLAARRTEQAVRFSVHDSGPGIEADQVPVLFEAYRQGNRHAARSGLGLGLYISKALTQAHGGTIGVDTVPARGSTFWFELPTTSGRASTPTR